MTHSRFYTIVQGFFLQDDPEADGMAIGGIPERFGLIDRSPECWKNFRARVNELNKQAEEGTAYKVFFLSRHGQGWHNVAEAKYGREAWDEIFSKQFGDDEITWGPDPLLTPLGIAQAHAARTAWLAELPNGIPLPQLFYCSPLKRALDTWRITFDDGKILPAGYPNVLIIENLREEYGEHTCDMRSQRSQIAEEYPPPLYTFEDGFAEKDLVWDPLVRESKEHVRGRALNVLDRIFKDDGDVTYITITAHSGIINAFLAAMNRDRYELPTGGILPLVVKCSPA
ncbi:phosphoglycerate mutase-like protein [Obba rivulosa]|uniref:Phosphoglycerate mutase-like protein n=1 Tax=Obba rivulosa TaxID=1052685 RepID=A0A8E2AZF1_9APHY|nr:phosphoglycerate mutase-like protein [Obba rivulosa]